ncbi:ribose 5-phosphate isomerase B, also acts on [Candidatus Moduliflexus flocculans]|uniref:Ribose 5-phosphate isomerase B, also acts on n=1 Tax=Candidatus Moduliflexus flocculans TaxID=1499966 RepID=A0A0S6VYB8_9BACT|nr:ribose 5-phosphate isomerase B, also acts on [Candidatus Moduliflexus flocculans]
MADQNIEAIVQKIVGDVLAQMTAPPTSGGSAQPVPVLKEKPVNEKDVVRRVVIGSDHTTVDQKAAVKTYLQSLGYDVTDIGPFTAKEKVDYPDFAAAVARKVASGECDRGIMLDGAGIGSSMVCNKIRGIRAALCYSIKTVVNSREHNNANVLTLGGSLHSNSELCELSKVWLETRFEGGRHWPRINKMMALEREERGHGSK